MTAHCEGGGKVVTHCVHYPPYPNKHGPQTTPLMQHLFPASHTSPTQDPTTPGPPSPQNPQPQLLCHSQILGPLMVVGFAMSLITSNVAYYKQCRLLQAMSHVSVVNFAQCHMSNLRNGIVTHHSFYPHVACYSCLCRMNRI